MPQREQAVLLKAMHSLWEGSVQKGASKCFSFRFKKDEAQMWGTVAEL